MKILGIETSCDETAAAVVENGTKILSSVVATSSGLHQKTGGVIPEVAAREQMKCIILVIEDVLSNLGHLSNLKPRRIDAIAVTVGPGLIGSLLVGVETAKTLAYVWNKPIIPINHLVAHIYANWLDVSSLSLRGASATKQSQEIATPLDELGARNDNNKKPEFPALCLVVSGGHTELVLMENYGNLKYLGGTRDDAAGECFDKSARLLGLAQYNGGPAIAKAAETYTVYRIPYTVHLPRPMIDSNDLDFSFSGLKTAVLREVNKLKTIKQFNNQTINMLAYELQEAITDVLVTKVIKAAEIYKPKSILLAGGVAANKKLTEKLSAAVHCILYTVNLFVPPPKLCTDNAAYIASCAFFNYQPVSWQKITANPSLEIVKP